MSANSGLNFPGVYTITNSVSGKVYVGQAINIRRRWHSHKWHLAKGAHRNHHLQRSWNKHGAAAFVFAVVTDLSSVPKEDLVSALNTAEIEVLSRFPRSYNLMEAAKSGAVASKETRALLSKQRLKLWQDPDFRERRRIAHSAACANSDLQLQRSISLRIALNKPEYAAKRSALTKQSWANNDKRRKTQSALNISKWQNPEYREQQAASRSAAWQIPELREKRIASLKAAWVGRCARMNKKD